VTSHGDKTPRLPRGNDAVGVSQHGSQFDLRELTLLHASLDVRSKCQRPFPPLQRIGSRIRSMSRSYEPSRQTVIVLGQDRADGVA
jgi:hypothetical protein